MTELVSAPPRLSRLGNVGLLVSQPCSLSPQQGLPSSTFWHAQVASCSGATGSGFSPVRLSHRRLTMKSSAQWAGKSAARLEVTRWVFKSPTTRPHHCVADSEAHPSEPSLLSKVVPGKGVDQRAQAGRGHDSERHPGRLSSVHANTTAASTARAIH